MVIDGKVIKNHRKIELINKIKDLNSPLKIVILVVGENSASKKYVDNKVKFASTVGIEAVVKKFSSDVQTSDLIKVIEELNSDNNITGMIVQLPLPSHFNKDLIIDKINPLKDLDGFTSESIGKLFHGNDFLVPCTVQGIYELITSVDPVLVGKNICIAGTSQIVGRPLALYLLNHGATVTVCNSKTKNIKKFIDNSDIFISAIGKPHFFTKDYFVDSNELIVIDVGINFTKDQKMVGDIDFEGVYPYVKAITPVPGGVGQMTVLNIMENTVKAGILQKGEK